jgi:chromosome segregation ATPase
MTDDRERPNLRARGEEALGDLAEALLENQIVGQALSTALGAGERAAAAQRSAMGALNIASSADLERLSRRLRSLSDRLEAVEDRLDEVADEVGALRAELGRLGTGDSRDAASVAAAKDEEA